MAKARVGCLIHNQDHLGGLFILHKKEGYCFRNSPQCNKYKNIIITEMIFQYKK
ncbi:hypothetical protein SAMN04487821_1104 [Enterococcus malodoratus]|nr:hypothetical protein SAMN04487821_1104 [Enterococcus malodoratus]